MELSAAPPRRALRLCLERIAESVRALAWRIEFLVKVQSVKITLLLCSVRTLLFLAACSRAHGDPAAEAPPTPNVVPGADVNLSAVENPERFPVAPLGWAENSLLGGASKPQVPLGRFGGIWIVPESMVLAHDRAESWSAIQVR
jgi:hypothetical protein